MSIPFTTYERTITMQRKAVQVAHFNIIDVAKYVKGAVDYSRDEPFLKQPTPGVGEGFTIIKLGDWLELTPAGDVQFCPEMNEDGVDWTIVIP